MADGQGAGPGRSPPCRVGGGGGTTPAPPPVSPAASDEADKLPAARASARRAVLQTVSSLAPPLPSYAHQWRASEDDRHPCIPDSPSPVPCNGPVQVHACPLSLMHLTRGLVGVGWEMHWRSGHACASDEISPSRERVALPLAPCSCWGARRWGFRAMRSREGGAGSADVLAIRTHNPRRFAVAPPRRAWGSTRSSTFAELPAEVQAGAVVVLARHVRDEELHELHAPRL